MYLGVIVCLNACSSYYHMRSHVSLPPASHACDTTARARERDRTLSTPPRVPLSLWERGRGGKGQHRFWTYRRMLPSSRGNGSTVTRMYSRKCKRIGGTVITRVCMQRHLMPSVAHIPRTGWRYFWKVDTYRFVVI